MNILPYFHLGRLNGSLTQYKPDLKEAKTIPGPNQDFSAVSILWVSTYQFLVGYKNIADSNSRAGKNFSVLMYFALISNVFLLFNFRFILCTKWKGRTSKVYVF